MFIFLCGTVSSGAVAGSCLGTLAFTGVSSLSAVMETSLDAVTIEEILSLLILFDGDCPACRSSIPETLCSQSYSSL